MSDYDEGDITDLDDELDEAMADCQSFLENGVIVCGAVGSEQCDECPFSNDLGLTPAEAEERAVQEVLADVQAKREAKGNAEYDSWDSTDRDGATLTKEKS